MQKSSIINNKNRMLIALLIGFMGGGILWLYWNISVWGKVPGISDRMDTVFAYFTSSSAMPFEQAGVVQAAAFILGLFTVFTPGRGKSGFAAGLCCQCPARRK